MAQNFKKILIVGYGQIGQGLHKVYEDCSPVEIHDPHVGELSQECEFDVMNICIPYSEKFVDQVNDYVDKFQPKLTIIHSTVAPHTTKKIRGLVCHSPVRGLHPHLDTGIKTFVKYVGSESAEAAKLCLEHLEELKIETFLCRNSLTSELAKLLDTSYYGACIAFHAEVNEICEKEGLDFDEVMTTYNQTYNQGYTKLGRPFYSRPVLYPTKKIGGHCVVPNARILGQFYDLDFIRGILKYE